MSFISRISPRINNGSQFLTDEQIRHFAPSVFAETAHESRSQKFAYIPTMDVLAGLRREGFEVTRVSQGRSRIPGKAEFTKHMIRLRRADDTGVRVLGMTFPEVVLRNAHDGTSAYKLDAGLMRLVCLNGMVAPAGARGSLSIPHKGDIVGRVIEGTFTVIDDSMRAIGQAEEWQQIQLSPDESRALANAAHTVRFADSDGVVETPIQPEQLLRARRRDDASFDLWTTFNRIQENAVRGGISAMGRDANNALRRTTTREIHGIDANVKLNQALFTLAEEMARLKS